jgi:hypothetical protein
MRTYLASILVFAACGGGGSPAGGVDAPGTTRMDAAVVVPTTLKLSGSTAEITASGRTPVAAAVSLFSNTSTTPVATGNSAADGTFSLMITTNGTAVDGYLLAKKSGDLDTYLYPPAPLSADFNMATVLLLSSTNFGLAQTLSGATQNAGEGFVGVLVADASGAAVAGATVTTSPPGMVRYNGSNGLPAKPAAAMSTSTDGVAYVFGLPAGPVSVGATMGGTTFHTHAVNARADVVTLTLVTP